MVNHIYSEDIEGTICGCYTGRIAREVSSVYFHHQRGVNFYERVWRVSCPECLGAIDSDARSEPSPSDLETPDGDEVDSGSTEEAFGPQISDPVEKPAHYQWLPVEAIEITEHFNYCTGNALKYIIRADHKGKPVEDLRKAVYYLKRELRNRGYEGDL